jgi:hypothetical protein
MMLKAQNGEYDFSSKDLIKKCVEYIEKNTKDIIKGKSWLKFNEETLIEILKSSTICIGKIIYF